MIQTKTTSVSRLWNANLRIRVGDSVTHNAATWVNKTGINEEPSNTSSNWDLVFSENTDIITLSGTRFRICKLATNPTLGVPETGDYVVNGRLPDALILYAEYSGTGDINNFGTLAANFTDGSYTKVKHVK